MDLEETLALKRTNLEKLIQNADEAIRNEMLKYEEAELYIRLQSECFNLYPVVIKALALLIADDRRREIFCSILKGHKLKDIAAAHSMTPVEVANLFHRTVWNLNKKINNGALTAKGSVNLRLMQERNMLKNKLLDYNRLCHQLQLENIKLCDQIAILLKEKKENTEHKPVKTHEKKQIIKEQTTKKQVTKKETTQHVSIFMRCVKWLELVYSRL
ncbi:hypothetical protein [Bacteroides sp.]|uniref:hypothetical protein n=1 Tax=Bacteroides sp. TaxID=29523 RepID=UPI002621CAEA|nr:hypothetical protein [Bacteroides sp.]MDD3037426.1 hypothetical protein [Bacteroides sp.]